MRSSIYMLAAGAFPSAGAEFPSWLLHWRPLPRWNPFVRRRRLFSASGIVRVWARMGPHVSCRNETVEFGALGRSGGGGKVQIAPVGHLYILGWALHLGRL